MMLSEKDILRAKKIICRSDEAHMPLMFNVLSDLTRFRIFQLLAAHQHDVCVTDIARITGVSVSAVSQHMKIFESADIVTKERVGQMICYRLRKNHAFVKGALSVIKTI